MIKTIDTDVITDEMLYAGVYAAERCSDAGITDLKDVIYDAIFAALKAAPAVEPAQSELLEVVIAMRDWIDAVPHDLQLPTMPGFDRDWADAVIADAQKGKQAQSVAESVSKEWDSLGSIGNRLHNISVEQHYAGNEKLSNELGEFASLLWIWDRTRKPTVPPAIVEPAQAVPVAHMRVMVGCRAPDDCEEYLDVCNPDDVGIDGKAFPVYKVPPAIDDAPRQKAIAHLKSWRINNPVDWVDRRHNSLIHSTLLILEAGNE